METFRRAKRMLIVCDVRSGVFRVELPLAIFDLLAIA